MYESYTLVYTPILYSLYSIYSDTMPVLSPDHPDFVSLSSAPSVSNITTGCIIGSIGCSYHTQEDDIIMSELSDE